MFPEDNVWNARVDSLPRHPNSATYVANIGVNAPVHPDFGTEWEGAPIGIPYNIVPGNQPRLPITFYYDEDSDPGPYPIPPIPLIEGGSDGDGDRHILVLDEDHCILYEVFDAWPEAGGSWEAGSGAIFDLNSNDLRTDTWTSADAAGFAILPGLVRYDEVLSGEITHALRFTAPRTQGYIWPARHNATTGVGPPLGMRFRLKANFNIQGFSPFVQVILTAMKNYGIMLADNGSAWYISGVPDTRWNDDMLVNELKRVHGSDFEAVDESANMVDPDSGQILIPDYLSDWLPLLLK